MTDYIIPMIIGMTLAFTLGAAFGALWGLSRHEWLYCRVTAHLTRRMREAMKSLGIDEWKIDKAQEYMGSVVIPPHIPMPKPPVKAASEREQCQTFFLHLPALTNSRHHQNAARWVAPSAPRSLFFQNDNEIFSNKAI